MFCTLPNMCHISMSFVHACTRLKSEKRKQGHARPSSFSVLLSMAKACGHRLWDWAFPHGLHMQHAHCFVSKISHLCRELLRRPRLDSSSIHPYRSFCIPYLHRCCHRRARRGVLDVGQGMALLELLGIPVSFLRVVWYLHDLRLPGA